MNFKVGIESQSKMPSSSNRQRKKKQQQLSTIVNSKSTSNSVDLKEKSRLIAKRKSEQEMLRHEAAKIVLWRQPLRTLQYSLLELIYLIHHYFKQLISYRKTLSISSIILILFIFIYKIEGSHQESIQNIESLVLWALYWFGLGIASSVGLGTGLHTFLLYLGPFIAQVTIAAYECGSIKFPRPPYPNEIICPPTTTTTTTTTMMSNENETILNDLLLETGPISFWKILWKVKLEAFFWGLGTAFGELPPYFMARTASLGTNDADDEKLLEFQQMLINDEKHQSKNLTLIERTQHLVFRLIRRIGFFGILLCASIPNPLFDLAGITCGYFLIPFWTFFLATIIGKALIKMSIQTVFIIFIFSEHHVERIIRWIKYIPYYGRSLQLPFKDWLQEQKGKMHSKPDEDLTKHVTKISLLTRIFNILVTAMIIYFIASIINSLAQRYYKRKHCALKLM